MGTGRLGRIFGVDFTAGSGGEWVIMVDPPAKGGSTVRMIRIDPGGSGEGIVHTHVVPTVGKTSLAALMARDDFKVGWARLPDDSDVIYLYGGTDGFGYAINVACDWCSEWGYAPFDPQGPDDSSSVEESAVVDALSASEGCSVTETDEQIVLPTPNFNERYPQAVIGVEWVDVPARATGRALPVPVA